jgi:hypothetical protein
MQCTPRKKASNTAEGSSLMGGPMLHAQIALPVAAPLIM